LATTPDASAARRASVRWQCESKNMACVVVGSCCGLLPSAPGARGRAVRGPRDRLPGDRCAQTAALVRVARFGRAPFFALEGQRRSISSSAGEATKIEEYVPTT